MLNFNKDKYTDIIENAINLIPKIEEYAEIIHKDGFSNLFFIGCGGTYALAQPIKFWLDSCSAGIESHVVTAAEFMLMKHKRFTKNSLCIFCTRSGNTEEIVQAMKYCKDFGARTILYVCTDNSPCCTYTDYKLFSYAEDYCLGETMNLYLDILIGKLMSLNGEFDSYHDFSVQYRQITPFLVKAKEMFEARSEVFAKKHKNTPYHMVVGSGMLWGEAYDYAMCILEEMQWLKTKSIHAAEFFHGTLELVESDTSMILLYGEDETRPLMDRVMRFAESHTKNIMVLDTKEFTLPFDKPMHRGLFAPSVIYAITDRLSVHLEKEREHPLSTRRYYRQMKY